MNLPAILKGYLKSKTFWLAVATFLATNVDKVQAAIEHITNPKTAGAVLAVLMLVVRYFTSEPIAEKGGAPAPPAT